MEYWHSLKCLQLSNTNPPLWVKKYYGAAFKAAFAEVLKFWVWGLRTAADAAARLKNILLKAGNFMPVTKARA